MNIKAYVYDTSKMFSYLIKHYYSEKMNIDVCTKKKNFFIEDIIDYEVCFFIVNDMDDFFNMRNVYLKIEHFFISSPNSIICEKIRNLNYDDVVYINFNNNKYEIFKEINASLTLKSII
jgi:hypothetical protein